MNSSRPDKLSLSSQPPSPAGFEEDKKKEKVVLRSRIPQMMSPPVVRRRIPSKKAVDCHSLEPSRPKSATTRLAPAHPSQLLQGIRQNRAIGKDRPTPKRPSNLPKLPLSSFRPQTPVIKVPMSSEISTMLSRDDRTDTDFSVCSNDHRSETKRRDPKFSSQDKRRMQLKVRWQENIAKFESTKRQLYEKQRGLLELYATLRTNQQELSDMGQPVSLPSSEELQIMNVAKLAPGQLLQLVAETEASEIVDANPPFDINLLNEIPNNIVATCERTLESRKDIIDWFEEVTAKKMITKNILIKKIKEFKAENDEFKRILVKNKEDYTRFLNETGESFKKSVNDTLTNHLRFQGFTYKMTELNALNENLRQKLRETEQELASAANKTKELENELKEVKYKRRDHLSRADIQVKTKEDKIAHITAALEQANSKSLSLEKTVCQLREENKKMQSIYDKKLKKLNESVDINTRLFDEITADRSKLLTEKQELENRLADICKLYEEAMQNTKHESCSGVTMGITRGEAGWAVPTPEVPGAHPRILGFCISRASGNPEKIDLTDTKLIEAEKKYNEALEEKEKLEKKIESLCAQLLESELRFKEVSKKLSELELLTIDASACRKEMETMICQLASANKELVEYKELAANQKEAMKELERNWKNAASLEEQLKTTLHIKEKYILDLELKQPLLEQRLNKNELKIKSYEEELSILNSHMGQLKNVFGEFKSWEDLQEMVKQRDIQLKETMEQNSFLTDALKTMEMELQQQVKTITEQGQLIEEQDLAMKTLRDKNEEQNNIINVMQNDLDKRAEAAMEFDQQIAEKNTEIDSLVSNVEKRKQQISQLEKIILTLEKQTLKLTNQKKTARETISSLEKKLSDYKSYYMINTKNTESSADNLDELINILEYELANPSEGLLNNSQEYLIGPKKLIERQNKRGTHNNFRGHSQDSMPHKIDTCNHVNNTELNEDKHNGDNLDGNKLITGMASSEFVASPKMTVSATVPVHKDKTNGMTLPTLHTRHYNYCLIPNYIRDEKKIKMFKLAGHRLQ